MPRSCPVPPRRRVRPAHVCLGANPARGREFTRARTELATIHLPQPPSLRRCDRNLPRSRRQMCLGCGLHACAGPDTHADPPATPPGRAATSCAPVLHGSHRTSHSRESLAGNRWIEPCFWHLAPRDRSSPPRSACRRAACSVLLDREGVPARSLCASEHRKGRPSSQRPSTRKSARLRGCHACPRIVSQVPRDRRAAAARWLDHRAL